MHVLRLNLKYWWLRLLLLLLYFWEQAEVCFDAVDWRQGAMRIEVFLEILGPGESHSGVKSSRVRTVRDFS